MYKYPVYEFKNLAFSISYLWSIHIYYYNIHNRPLFLNVREMDLKKSNERSFGKIALSSCTYYNIGTPCAIILL